MALNSSRSAWSLSRQSLHSLRASPTIARPACRGIAELARQPTALREQDDPLNEPLSDEDIEQAKPRWAYTPSGLKAPYDFKLKEAKNPANSIWHVNEDPAKLDEFYERFLGRNGSRMLPEELRWLAVTHKSFDYGRRGFNTKLAFFGRQVLVLETMNGIMTQPNEVEPFFQDPWYREHFRSPALANVDKLSKQRPHDYVSIEGLAKVGLRTQLDQVMRWKPKNTSNLSESGIDVALCTTLFAIVGAVSMQHGGEVASRVAREKVLGRMRSRN
ncbi:hypothetical protein N0V82_005559 [Gnomoniopsis sp. IMI 355080]|nr:hypothetical protein N0V82_005559 [Gnomoniopsis sp. IMI 355080]